MALIVQNTIPSCSLWLDDDGHWWGILPGSFAPSALGQHVLRLGPAARHLKLGSVLCGKNKKLNHWKGSLNHPKKVTSRIARCFFSVRSDLNPPFVYFESLQQIMGMVDSFPWLFGVYAGMIFWGVSQTPPKNKTLPYFRTRCLFRIEGEVDFVLKKNGLEGWNLKRQLLVDTNMEGQKLYHPLENQRLDTKNPHSRSWKFLFRTTENPRKPTWQWKIYHLKTYFLLVLKMGMFQCHVSFQGAFLVSILVSAV